MCVLDFAAKFLQAADCAPTLGKGLVEYLGGVHGLVSLALSKLTWPRTESDATDTLGRSALTCDNTAEYLHVAHTRRAYLDQAELPDRFPGVSALHRDGAVWSRLVCSWPCLLVRRLEPRRRSVG